MFFCYTTRINLSYAPSHRRRGCRSRERWHRMRRVRRYCLLVVLLVPALGDAVIHPPLAAAWTVSNSAPIAIEGAGPANPYPSQITVGGSHRPISKVIVRLNGVTHPNPDDLDIWLQGPDDTAVMLMSDTGGA